MYVSIIIKKLLILSIISIFTGSSILPITNKLRKKSQNIVNSDKNKTSNSDSTINYIDEKINISFQINILKNAISKNNFIFKESNVMFKHTIYHIGIQKKYLRNKIKLCNLSIIHELNILYNIKKILNNHPYDYLSILQNRNYILPNSYFTNNNKGINVLNNVETCNYKIINLNTDFNSISYNAEESIVGFESITSLISNTKSIIFSKIHFYYGNITYFSGYLNNLTTINQFTNLNKLSGNNNLDKNNEFINKPDIYYKKKSMNCKNDLSKISSNSNNKIHKSYVIFTPLFIGAGVIVVFFAKLWSRKAYIKKLTEGMSMNTKISKRVYKVKKKFQTKSIMKKSCIYKKKKEPKAEINLELSERNSANEITLSIKGDNNALKVASSEIDLLSSNASDINHIDDSKTGTSVVTLPESMEFLPPNNTQESLSKIPVISQSVGKYYLNFKLIPSNSPSDIKLIRTTMKPTREKWRYINHTHLDHKLPDVDCLNREDIFLKYPKDTQLKYINNWLRTRSKYNDLSFTCLYKRKKTTKNLKQDTFDSQVSSFLYQRRLGSLDEDTSPNSIHIIEDIKNRIKRLGDLENGTKTTKTDLKALEIIEEIILFRKVKILRRQSKTTTHGWFELPPYRSIRKFDHNKLSVLDYNSIKWQHDQFMRIKSLLPEYRKSSEYFDELLNEYDTIPKSDCSISKLSEVDKLIVNEIIYDLHEVVDEYILYSNIPDVSEEILSKNSGKCNNIKDLITCFKQTKIVRDNFGYLEHSDITEEDVFNNLSVLKEI